MPSLVKTEGNFCTKSSSFQISTSDEHELNFKWSLLQKLYLMWHRIMIDMTIGEYLIIFPQGSLLSQALWCMVEGLQLWKKMTLLINKFHMYCKLQLVYTVDFSAVVWKSPTQGALLTVHKMEDIQLNSEREGVWRNIKGSYEDFPLRVKWLTRWECR